jgi:hypothetical protein
MDLQTLTHFFMWCTILNGGLLLVATAMCVGIPDFIYQVHRRLFLISREAFAIILYCFLGILKVLFLVFGLAPYVALLIVG